MLDVILRDVRENDLSVLFEHQQDPDATRMAAFAARDKDAFAAHWANILRDDGVAKKAIIFNGELAGNIVSFQESGRLLVGYWIGKPFWRKGVATAALRKFLEESRSRPLYALVARHNIGSRRVLEKCGFKIADQTPAEFLFKLLA